MNLSPVDPDTFAFIFNLASAAMDMKLPAGALPTLVGKTIDIDVEPGRPQTITFQNKAVVRMMDAVASQVSDPDTRISAAARIFHLYALLERPEARPFMRNVGDDRLMHPALMAVAAVYPIDPDDGFESGFFDEVAVIARDNPIPEP
jgi:hypothetical protein